MIIVTNNKKWLKKLKNLAYIANKTLEAPIFYEQWFESGYSPQDIIDNWELVHRK